MQQWQHIQHIIIKLKGTQSAGEFELIPLDSKLSFCLEELIFACFIFSFLIYFSLPDSYRDHQSRSWHLFSNPVKDFELVASGS